MTGSKYISINDSRFWEPTLFEGWLLFIYPSTQLCCPIVCAIPSVGQFPIVSTFSTCDLENGAPVAANRLVWTTIKA
ncbi:MAG: hypothetical protein K0R28_3773, partial [Paenibacillus sp.]|nr:hypothetical protein [Paenibacillus sp.]